MPFTNIFGLNGQYLTYRGFWALTLGSYAGLQVLSCIVVSVMCQKYGVNRASQKPVLTIFKCKLISSVIAFIYAFILVTLSIVNGLMVFGSQSILVYMGVLLGVQTVFVMSGVFVQLPYLAEYILCVSNWSIAGSIFFLIQIPSMFDYASSDLTWLIAIFASVPLVIKSAFTNMRITQTSTIGWSDRFQKNKRKAHFWLTLIIVTGIGILLAFFLAGTCITIYDPDVNGTWIPFGGTVRWSSRMMRSLSYKPRCTGTDPCHVYLTAGSDLTSEMFVTVHIALGSAKSVFISILDAQASVQRSIPATEFAMPLLDSHDDRLVYSAYISNLASGSEISFSISTENGPIGESAYFFKTASLTEPLNFVVAGDSGVTSDAFSIMNQMVLADPILAIIGGDVVYDNGFIACACSWDQWLTSWEGKRVDNKYMIPLSLAVGNHDVGVNDNNKGAFDAQEGQNCDLANTVHAKPLFYAWFPFEADSEGNVIPVCERSTMHVHYVPNLTNIWILDSAYTVSTEANVAFVRDVLAAKGAEMNNSSNLAAYHVPLYASNTEDVSNGEYLISAWVSPLFDAFGFALCFEHHGHTYKRTKPLYNNEAAASGTVYLGDGKMGIEGMAVPGASEVIQPSDTNFFEVTGTQYHFFSVSVRGTQDIQVAAVDDSGTSFDSLVVQ